MKALTHYTHYALLFILMTNVKGPVLSQSRQIAETYLRKNASKAVHELVKFVSIPNDVSHVDQIQKSAAYLRGLMEKRHIAVELIPTPSGRPLVFGTLNTPGVKRTLLLYSHYDGVPANETNWHSDPYRAVIRAGSPLELQETNTWADLIRDSVNYKESWRIYGRSVADSKNAIISILAALDAIEEAGIQPGVNIKFLFDGEEEMESPGLLSYLRTNPSKFKADLMISASGETHQSGLPTLAFGERGIVIFSLKTHTAVADMHSGHFGNYTPNAALRLAELLSTMKDDQGRVTMEGFYDDVPALTAKEQIAIQKIPQVEKSINEKFGIIAPEYKGLSLQQLINLPTLNVRGMRAGYMDSEARNIIPSHAEAEIDVRLVKGMQPDKVLQSIRNHITHLGWTVLDHTPSKEELLRYQQIVVMEVKASFPAAKTSLEEPISAELIAHVTHATGLPLVIEPTDGGSLPLYLFENAGIPIVASPLSNSDCNQHTADENLLISHFFRGIKIFTSVLLWNR
jgi:acetylornithine deacetylase/succinyl-diaminopimelate desuccinylase-like protein